ncbi:uncharacterized protein CBL_07622 [Carabus blaptoides fortunei]
MFRKGFREQKCTTTKSSGGVKSAAGRHPKRTNRDHGYTAMDEYHYRTHIFFSPHPHRTSYTAANEEPRCGPVSGGATIHSGLDQEPPQPLVVRSPSVSLIKWPSTPVRSPSPTGYPPSKPHTQPPENNNNNNSGGGGGGLTTAAQPVSLTALDRDCFIIPVHSVDRFLPAGVPLPVPNGLSSDKKSSAGLSVLEVPDPKLCILAHLMSPLEAIDPILESPMIQPIQKQRKIATELMNEIAQANSASSGMLLANMERNAEFPFISYYVINSTQTNPAVFYNNLRTSSLSKFDPRAVRYTAAHTLDLYGEVAAICRPPLQDTAIISKSHTAHTGYIISVYKVFEGDDGELFERNWLYWTGARMLYRYLPRCAGLRRIALHKSLSPKGDKMYLLVCECASLLQDVSASALLIPALRARLCGHTGLYRPIQTF